MRGCPHGRGIQPGAPTDSSRFTKEFKGDAVELVRTTGRPIAVVARELGVHDSTLGNWVRQDRIDGGQAEGLTSEERARLRQLEADKARLRMERELLKRTVAFWVKEPSTPSAAPAASMPEGRRVPVVAACRAAGVSASAFDAWAARCEQGHRWPSMPRLSWSPRSAASRPSRVALRVAAGDRRAAPAWMVGEPPAGGAAEAAHGIVGHRPHRRRGLTKPDPATHPRRSWWGGWLP
jgi:transposase